MNHRPRSVAGLLALFALSLFLAEGIWTAMCPPGSGDEAVTAVVAASGAPDEASPEASDHERAGSEAETGCPLGVIAAGGCVSVAVLSAPPPTPSNLDPGAEPFVLPEVRSDLLLPSSLFRPPRA